MGLINDELYNIPYIIEIKGIVFEVNALFCELTGYTSDAILNKPIGYVFKELLRINSNLDIIDDNIDVYFLNKVFEPCEARIIITQDSKTTCRVYRFLIKTEPDLLSRMPFLSNLYHDNQYGIAIYDSKDFLLLKANTKYLEMLDLPLCSLGKTLKQIAPDFEGSETEKRWKDAVLSEKPTYLKEYEGTLSTMKGRYWENTLTPVKFDGKVKFVVSLLIDVTEKVVYRQQLEEKTRCIIQQNELLEAIVDNLQESLYVSDNEGKFIIMNKAAVERRDIKFDNNKSLYEYTNYYYMDGTLLPKEGEATDRALRGLKTKNKVLYFKKNDKTLYSLVNGTPVFDKENKFLYSITTVNDISDFVESQLTLKNIQEQLLNVEREKNEALQVSLNKIEFQARLLNLSFEAICAWDLKGNIVYWNTGAEKMYGYSKGEAEGKNIHDLLMAKHPCSINTILSTLESGEIWSGEIEHTTKDGRKLIIETNFQLMFNDMGQEIVLEINRDITERKRIEDVIAEANDRLYVALESVGAGIWELDLKTNNQVWSPKVYELYGFEPSEFVPLEKGMGRVHPGDREEIEASLDKAFKTHCQIWRKDFRIINPKRGIVWVKGTGKIIYDKNNIPIKIIGINIDITEQKEQQQAILNAEYEKNEALENAIKIKDEFLYLITHEFKTPIAVIDSALQTLDLLYHTQLPHKVNKFIHTIKQNTNRQLRLVNNLLDITRINAGRIKINNGAYDIVYLISSIVNSIQPIAQQKGVNVHFTSKLVNEEILVDEEKIERILMNLLSNALKFTHEGKSINVTLSEKNISGKASLCISVKDEGIGIPKDKQAHIFERFGQADTSLSRQAEGTGIGLYLVKLLVSAMGGTITLKSTEGKGSTFKIVLPYIKALPLEVAAAGDEEEGQFVNRDSRLVQAVAIEFSDIYL